MKKVISVFLVLLMIFSFTFGILASAEPSKKPSLNILVMGSSMLESVLRVTRTIGLTQNVDISFYMPVGQNDSLANISSAVVNDLIFCENHNTGGFYCIDTVNPEGTMVTNPTASTSFSRLFGKYEFDAIVYTGNVESTTDEGRMRSSITYIQESVEKYTDKEIKTYWHDFWSLEKSSSVPLTIQLFARYNNDWRTMQEAITSSSEFISSLVDEMIPVGSAFTAARTDTVFNPDSGSVSLLDDETGALSDAGRYLAALVWYMSLTGCKVNSETVFKPYGLSDKIAPEELVTIAENIVIQSGIELKDWDEVFGQQGEQETSSGTNGENVYVPPTASVDGTPDGENKLDATEIILIAGAAVVVVAAVATVIIIKKKKSKNKE